MSEGNAVDEAVITADVQATRDANRAIVAALPSSVQAILHPAVLAGIDPIPEASPAAPSGTTVLEPDSRVVGHFPPFTTFWTPDGNARGASVSHKGEVTHFDPEPTYRRLAEKIGQRYAAALQAAANDDGLS